MAKKAQKSRFFANEEVQRKFDFIVLIFVICMLFLLSYGLFYPEQDFWILDEDAKWHNLEKMRLEEKYESNFIARNFEPTRPPN